MKNTILVTGSGSFVASFLIKKLKKKYNVIGIDYKKKISILNLQSILQKKFQKNFISLR